MVIESSALGFTEGSDLPFGDSDVDEDDRFFALSVGDGGLKFHGKLRPVLSLFKIEWRNYVKHDIEEAESQEANKLLSIGFTLIAYCCYDHHEGMPPVLNGDTCIDIRKWHVFLKNERASIKSELIAKYGRVDAKYAFIILWSLLVALGKLVDKQNQRPVTSWECAQPEGSEDTAKRVLIWLFRR
jgi:hypothetical protein